MVFYETEGDLVRRFVFICELQTVTKFWVALIEANAVFSIENRYLTNLCSYLLLIIIKIIFPGHIATVHQNGHRFKRVRSIGKSGFRY